MSDYNFHDQMSSWWCGKNVSYDLCVNTSGTCAKDKGISGAGNARSPQAGHNDSLDHVIMRHYDASEQGAVTLFGGANCTLYAGRFDTPSDPAKKAEYN